MSAVETKHVALVGLDDEGAAGEVLREIARERGGRLVNFHRMIANSPVVARGLPRAVYGLWNESRLGRRNVELVILRVSRVCDSDYEWAQHVRLARTAGLSEAKIVAVGDWARSDEFEPSERSMLALVDASLEGHIIDEDVMVTAREHLGADEIIDVITTAGLYRTVAVMLRTFAVPLDDDLVADA